MILPTVDVLMPVYNCEPYISEALNSILQQTYDLQKIIILDDASTDNTVALIKAICKSDPRLRLIQGERNQGIVARLNQGLAISTAKYIARMDGDDICMPDRIVKQVNFLENNEEYVACSGGFVRLTNSTAVPVLMPNEENNFKTVPAQQMFLQHPFLVVRRTALIDVGGYNLIHHCEDADLYQRLTSKGKLYNLQDILGTYRIHPKSVSSESLQTNMLQALHSQLLAIHAQRPGTHIYCEKRARKLHHFFESNEPCIKQALQYSKTIYDLSEDEYDWLQLAFPFKLIQNTKWRDIPLRPSEIKYFNSIVNTLLFSASPHKKKCLYHFYKVLRQHQKSLGFFHPQKILIEMRYRIYQFYKTWNDYTKSQ